MPHDYRVNRKKTRQNKHSADIRERFGYAVQKRRLELDLSQEELAELSSLHRTYVSAIERGVQNISLLRMQQIAKALQITISELLIRFNVEAEESNELPPDQK